MNYEIESKTMRQSRGVARYVELNYIGIFDYVPRFGKTLTALKCASKFKIDKSYTDTFNIRIIVSKEVLLHQWEDSILFYNNTVPYEYQIHNFKVYTINTILNKYKDNSFEVSESDMYILDEIHKYTSEDAYNFIIELGNIVRKLRLSIIGLSGTLPPVKDNEEFYKVYPIIDVITEEDARKNKWISNYKEFNYRINFSEDEELAYIKYTEYITETLKLFDSVNAEMQNITWDFNTQVGLQSSKIQFKNTFELLIKCQSGYWVEHLNYFIKPDKVRKMIAYTKGWHKDLPLDTQYNKTINDIFNPLYIETRSDKFKFYIDKRNSIINDSITKKLAILELVDTFIDKKIIIFCGSIPTANYITDMINSRHGNKAICFHSKIESTVLKDDNGEIICYKTGNNIGKPKMFGKTSLRNLTIDGFKYNKYSILVTVNSLDEGLDIADMNFAIVGSGSTNPVSYKQRKNRVNTINPFNENETVGIVNVYFDDFTNDDVKYSSRDKVKLQTRQKENSYPPQYIKSISEIILD